MKIKDYEKRLLKSMTVEKRKKYQESKKLWDYKMIGPVTDFIFDLDNHIDWKKKTYKGNEIEGIVWKLLEKARRLK